MGYEPEVGSLTHRPRVNSEDSQLKALGRHIVADFHGCTSDLNSPEMICQTLQTACEISGATVVSRTQHHFSPYGVTVVFVIAESHLAVHTWPEYGYAAVDLFTCGNSVDVWKAFKHCEKEFGATRVELREITRGILSEDQQAPAQGFVESHEKAIA